MLFDWGELRDIRIFTEPFFFWLNGILKQHHWSFWSLNKRFYSHTLSFIVRPGRNLDLLFVQRLFLNFIIFHHLERLEIFKTKALGFFASQTFHKLLSLLSHFTIDRNQVAPSTCCVGNTLACSLSLRSHFLLSILFQVKVLLTCLPLHNKDPFLLVLIK